jgi:hypothetical protein
MNNYQPVNWVDGMKINKDHFIAERNAMLQLLSASTGAFINDVNYGLLPPVAAEHKPFKIYLRVDNQDTIYLKLTSCRAVTPGGHLIYVDEQSNYTADHLSVAPELRTPMSTYNDKPGRYAVVVSIDPYNRQPVGNASMEELPPRIPFSAPQLSLSLLPAEEMERTKIGLYQLWVGIVVIERGKVLPADEYIPPCSCPSAHPELTEVFYGLEEYMSKMELYVMQILQRIHQKGQNNELAQMIEQICERLLHFQSVEFSAIRWAALHQPPYVMFGHIVSQARIMKNVLDIYLNNGKEQLLTYFSEWCDLPQGELETVIIEVSNYKYRHEDIWQLVEKTRAYTKVVSSLFFKLSRLDYIGKKREAGIFVKEEVVQSQIPASTEKKRRSFLADE